jgi:drug/metabolite transporter (DMT)-like permease
VLAFAILEMAIPWILLTHAEEHLASGLAALIIASVPVVGALAAFALGERSALRPVRVAGIVLGLSGVALLVGRDLSGDAAPPWYSIAEVLVVVVCYATAPFIAARRLPDVPSLGVIAMSLGIVAVIYLPIAAVSLPDHPPPAKAVWSVLALATVCTGVAFVIFFRLIGEIGPARAGLITFANPVVAIALGALFLDETITVAIVVGFVLVIAGCWCATRPATAAADAPVLEPASP